MQTTFFSSNLRLLCGYKASIAEICRDLHINRSQFNKYLSGQSTPRQNLLRKIGDYFGVEDHEILLPTDAFKILISQTKKVENSASSQLQQAIKSITSNSDKKINDLKGNYFEYFQSMSSPKHILKALIIFKKIDDLIFYTRIEKIIKTTGGRKFFKYQGLVTMLAERIFMIDHENNNTEITQTILYPDYCGEFKKLHGIRVGVSANWMRTPCAARVFLEKLPNSKNIHSILRECGLYEKDSKNIPTNIIQHIDNSISGPHHFTPQTHQI